jgi:hypothetical protein
VLNSVLVGGVEGKRKKKEKRKEQTPHLGPFPQGERKRNSLSPWRVCHNVILRR